MGWCGSAGFPRRPAARVTSPARASRPGRRASRTTPDMFVIDRQGRLVYAGAIDDTVSTDVADAKTAHNYVAMALADLKAGRPINPDRTVSYGCSVKYQ